MKTKKILWMLAAILFCGVAAMFTSCINEDNPVDPVDNLSEKIIGKWMIAERDGIALPTNKKMVITFVSATKAYVSTSRDSQSEVDPMWVNMIEADVTISSNKVTLSFHPDEHNTSVHELTITAIDATEFSANEKVSVTIDGKAVISKENGVCFTRVNRDYNEAVLGLWECTGLTGGETFNDANARLEFLADGTYRYYRMDDNNDWQTVTTREFQNYFVDGTLLATRWKNQGEDELREWWEIESLSGNEMVWTALRQNADGSTFQQKMTWKKIDLNIAEKIIGKWMTADRDGLARPTNNKFVYTFVSPTKAYMSVSLAPNAKENAPWHDLMEGDVVIKGNKVTLTFVCDEHTTLVHEFIFTDITANEFTAYLNATEYTDGNVSFNVKETDRYVKVPTDYKADIVGTWQGHCTSEGSVFDDGQEHRWEYKADGTYVYYVKDGNNWVPYATNTLNEYFVDGKLLCTRWIDNGVENREWWEISIDGDQMNWTALRENGDGTTFTATFEMKKVE